MKQDWQIKKLGEVCEVIAGQSPEGKFYNTVGEGLPFYQGKKEYGEKYIRDPKTWTKKVTKEAFAGDILMSVRAPVGPVNFATQKICIGRGLASIRAGDLIDKEFLFYFLNNKEKELEGNSGAVFNSINKDQIKQIPIPLPPLSEQKKIVEVLDQAFAGIEQSRQNTKQNLKNAKEIFESYLQGVFENNGEDWEEKKLGDICKFVRGPFGGSLKKNIFKPSGYAVYEQQHAIYDQFVEIRYFIDEVKFNEMKRFELNEGDLIMSCSGTMGRVAIVPKGIKQGIINQALLKISTDKKILNTYLKWWMESESFQNSLKKYSGGAAIQNVASVSILKSIEVPLPSIKQQQNIVHQLDALRAETQKLEAIYTQKLNALDELQKSLLQKAFAGELVK